MTKVVIPGHAEIEVPNSVQPEQGVSSAISSWWRSDLSRDVLNRLRAEGREPIKVLDRQELISDPDMRYALDYATKQQGIIENTPASLRDTVFNKIADVAGPRRARMLLSALEWMPGADEASLFSEADKAAQEGRTGDALFNTVLGAVSILPGSEAATKPLKSIKNLNFLHISTHNG